MWTQPLPSPVQLLATPPSNPLYMGYMASPGSSITNDPATAVMTNPWTSQSVLQTVSSSKPVVVTAPLASDSYAPLAATASSYTPSTAPVSSLPPVAVSSAPTPVATNITAPSAGLYPTADSSVPTVSPAVTDNKPSSSSPPESPRRVSVSSNPEPVSAQPASQTTSETPGLTPEGALQQVQLPQALTSRPVDAARSFHIQPDGTVVDNTHTRLVPELPAPKQPFVKQHALALVGAGVGSIAAVKLHRTLKPVTLKRLYWQANTRWPEVNSLVDTVAQPVLKAIRENSLLNGSIAWAKATMCLTPVMTAAFWGEKQQRQWKKTRASQSTQSVEA